MKKLTVSTAAVAVAMLTVAAGTARADRFDPQLGGRGLVVKAETEVGKAAAKPEKAASVKTSGKRLLRERNIPL
jgi:hypothetical protein